MLRYKTLYAVDEKIYLFGGLAVGQEASMIGTLMGGEQGGGMMEVEGSRGTSNNKVSYREDYIL